MKEPTKNKNIGMKVVLVTIAVLFVIAVLASLDSNDNQSTTQPVQAQAAPIKQEAPAEPKTWQKVAELSGSSNKRSDVFHLQGGQQRITYTVNGTTYPMLYIYVMDATKSLETHGGFAEVMAQENGDTLSYRGAGDYYLDITSVNSDWTVVVEEKQ